MPLGKETGLTPHQLKADRPYQPRSQTAHINRILLRHLELIRKEKNLINDDCQQFELEREYPDIFNLYLSGLFQQSSCSLGPQVSIITIKKSIEYHYYLRQFQESAVFLLSYRTEMNGNQWLPGMAVNHTFKKHCGL